MYAALNLSYELNVQIEFAEKQDADPLVVQQTILFCANKLVSEKYCLQQNVRSIRFGTQDKEGS